MSQENKMIKINSRCLVPRGSGPPTPGVVVEIYGDYAKVRLDQVGRRGQPIGKTILRDLLKPIA